MVEGGGLENRYPVSPGRGFESPSFRILIAERSRPTGFPAIPSKAGKPEASGNPPGRVSFRFPILVRYARMQEMTRARPRFFLFWIVFFYVLLAFPAEASLIRVPEDYSSIKMAVSVSSDGDIIDVGDGFYFEKDIVIDRCVSLRSRRLFGAVISGSDNEDSNSAVLWVRSECEISGFIIKNCYHGIRQRGSLDADWKAIDLGFMDCTYGISIDDRTGRVGSVEVRNVIFDRGLTALAINDGRAIDARRVFISRARQAVSAFDYDRCFLDEIILWNVFFFFDPICKDNNLIQSGPSIFKFHSWDPPLLLNEMSRRFDGLFARSPKPGARDEDNRRRKAVLAVVLGESFLEAGDPRTATRRFQEAAILTSRDEVAEIQWRIPWGMARAAEAARDGKRAVGHYRKAVAEVDRIGLGIPLPDLLADFRREKIDLYDAFIKCLVAAEAREPGLGWAEEAFDVAEQSKARSLLSSLLAFGEGVENAGREARKKADLLAFRLSRCQLELQDPDLPPERRTALLEKLKRIEAERHDFFLQLGRLLPPEPRGTFIDTLSLDQVKHGLLGPADALVEYIVGKTASYAFLVTPNGFDVAVLPPEFQLKALVEGYLEFLTFPAESEFRGWSGGHRLWEILLGPFEDRLGSIDALIISPDGPLHHLPFETLVSDPVRRRFAVESHEFRYGHSASSLERLRRRALPSARPMDFLGVAATSRIPAISFETGKRINFPALPNTAREIQKIGRLFPPERTTILAGAEDLEAAFKAASLDAYGIIHFAAHGWIDDEEWMRSALLLGTDGSGGEDGFLQPAEIRRLPLRADLVVLSGCETAGGRLERGEGIRGLAQAFLKAGARSLVISQWSIEDRVAVDFMEAFYRGVAKGYSYASALRRAKLAFLESTRRHPYYWAPFVCLGP